MRPWKNLKMLIIFTRMIVLIMGTFLLVGCNQQSLLENLSQEQANQVMAILQQHNIHAEKAGSPKSGFAVTVPPSDITSALSVVAQYQLPRPAEVQIGQAFPDNALVASPDAEQTRILSLQEQRIEQSIRIIDQVVNARVHISYPSVDKDFDNHAATEHASILITYKGKIDQNLFISQIKLLIKNSFDNILYENISVVLFKASDITYTTQSPSHDKTMMIVSAASIILLGILILVASIFFYFRKHPLHLQNEAGNK